MYQNNVGKDYKFATTDFNVSWSPNGEDGGPKIYIGTVTIEGEDKTTTYKLFQGLSLHLGSGRERINIHIPKKTTEVVKNVVVSKKRTPGKKGRVLQKTQRV